MTARLLRTLIIFPGLLLLAGCGTTTDERGREITIRDRSPTTGLYPNGLPFALQPYPGSP